MPHLYRHRAPGFERLDCLGNPPPSMWLVYSSRAGQLSLFDGLGILRVRGFFYQENVCMPNAQTEPCDCLARKVPSRSEEKALSVTSNRIGSSASLGSLFSFINGL